MKEAHPYWQDPYRFIFDATIASCEENDEGFHVTLEEDIVRPEGGGQAGDIGIIKVNDREVLFSNTIMSNGEATLVTSGCLNEQECKIIIDRDWRLGMMRNHTGEHLFMSAMKALDTTYQLGYIWIDGNKGTIEVIGLDNESDIFAAEEQVQEWIIDEIPVQTKYRKPDEMDESIRAREGVTEEHERIRIIKVAGVDMTACSGTHVANSGDIHAFKIADHKFEETGTRIEFRTGLHALRMLSKVYNQVLERKESFPFEMQQIGAVLDKSKRIANDIERMKQKVRDLILLGPQIEDIGGVEFRHEKLPGFEMQQMRDILMSMSFDQPTAVLFFAPGEKSNLVFWTHALEKDASDYIETIVTGLGGRGGGSRDAFSGGFKNVEDPERLYSNLVKQLRKNLV